MGVTLSELNVDLRSPTGATRTHRGDYSGMAIVQQGRWVAICLELGTVAEGATAEEALDSLQAAVRDVVDVATEEGLEPGIRVPAEEIKRLITEHEGGAPVTLRNLIV